MYEIIDSYGRVYGRSNDLNEAFIICAELEAERAYELNYEPLIIIDTELMEEVDV